ncbi:FAD:protein FMN transferase [Tunturibacter empetritectus]|uniref:FAD:protein FMN transferase n=1 Tax=Tunturiibacter empetritectus TaxID=3069691 RepID=A0A7W8MQL1_9BACT|nr:FAD:protein FMN transferase [Edaphobacter lichenicola]MBB5315940.1 thiamine biosynthesis lipoprotein [Edaphobacter lichenicola]
MKRWLAVGWLAITLSVTPLAVGAAPSPLRLFTTTHPAMGTEFTLYLYSASPAAAAAASEEVFDEVDRIEQLLSNYRESSELSRINQNAQNAGAGAVTTDPEMMDFLEQSEHWSRASNGAFDITVGRLMKAWGFFRYDGRIPMDAELEDLRAVTGWEKVKLDPAARTVQFTSPGIELDPGGIGKGFAVDAAVRILRADHIRAAMLSAGSSTVYALGAPPHKTGWRVVVPGPLPSQKTLSVITLRDTSLSSADCSQKNFTVAGHRYCHIMDPRTMRPVEGRIQVSVVAPSATASDALSNVVFVETPEQSVATLKAFAPDAHALIVSYDANDAEAARCTTFQWTSSVDSTHCAL